jgi:hypothetical protein
VSLDQEELLLKAQESIKTCTIFQLYEFSRVEWARPTVTRAKEQPGAAVPHFHASW